MASPNIWLLYKCFTITCFLQHLLINPFFTLQAAIVNSQTLEEVARLEQVCFVFLSSTVPLLKRKMEEKNIYLNVMGVITWENSSLLAQALKSGQLPADLNLLEDNTAQNITKDKDDKTMSDSGDEEHVTNDESTPMEQVPQTFMPPIGCFLWAYFFFIPLTISS